MISFGNFTNLWRKWVDPEGKVSAQLVGGKEKKTPFRTGKEKSGEKKAQPINSIRIKRREN